MYGDKAYFGGIFHLKIIDKGGNILKDWWVKNKMTNASLAAISGLVGNTGSQVAFTYLAVGTSTTAVSAAHTALQAEITDSGLARSVAGTITRITTSQTNDTLSLSHTWTVTATKTIEEIGIFNASSGGTMLARALTTSKTVGNGVSVTATYTIQIVGN